MLEDFRSAIESELRVLEKENENLKDAEDKAMVCILVLIVVCTYSTIVLIIGMEVIDVWTFKKLLTYLLQEFFVSQFKIIQGCLVSQKKR